MFYYYLTGWLIPNIRLLWCEESSCVSAENQITLHIGVNLTDSEQREEKGNILKWLSDLPLDIIASLQTLRPVVSIYFQQQEK